MADIEASSVERAEKENQNGKIVLLDFNEIKKVADIKEATEKIQLVESVFGMTVDQHSTVSLQRFDVEWGEFVDVEIKEVKNRDKLKVKIVKNSLHTRKPPTQLQTSTDVNLEMSTTGCSTLLNGHSGEKAVDRMIKNLEEHRSTLQYRFEVAQATLSSLRERPRQREPLGRNIAFTCSNCHYRGHRVNNCRQPPCQGFFECGIAALHKEHREQIKKAEAEVKEVSKMLNENKEEITNTTLLKERTRANFFSVVRTRLQNCNPIKYSSRVCLDNDLRVLAAACKHKVPANGVNLEEIIENYKRNAATYKTSEYTTHAVSNRNYCQSPRPSHLQEKFSPRVNNYFNSCYDVSYSPSTCNYYGGRPPNRSPSPTPYDARTWHRGGRFHSPPTRSWSDNPNSWDSPATCSRSPSILTDKQPRKRLNYTNNKLISKQSKRSKQTLGREYRSSLTDKFPKQVVPRSSSVTNNAVSCSTPKKNSIVVTDGKSPEPLSESPVLAFKDSEESQPFNFETWSKERITQIRELENTESSQTP